MHPKHSRKLSPAHAGGVATMPDPIPKVRAGDLKGKIDFGIVTMREDEEEALLNRLPPTALVDTHHPTSATWPYAISYVNTLSGYHTVAVVRCLRQGNNESQRVAADLIRDLQPTWLLVVGIAGAVPDTDFTLGDVIISSQILDLTVIAVTQGGIEEYSLVGCLISLRAAVFIVGF